MSKQNYIVKDLLKRLLVKYSESPQEVTTNPFAAWGMSENDHTKLLVALLKCNDAEGRYPILKSFLARFTMLQCGELKKVKATFNQACGNGYIDGYITFECDASKSAVIIENKVYDALDQMNQVTKYIRHAITDIDDKTGDALQRIWVLYITRDGTKTVSKYSYNIENQEPSTNIGNRFVEINYKEHIIDWLNELQDKPECSEAVKSIVRVYQEYLKYEFNNLSHRKKFLINAVGISEDIQLIEEKQVKALYALRHEIQDIKKKRSRNIDERAVNNISSALSDVFLDLEKLAFDKFEKQTKVILDEWTRDQGPEWKVAHRGLRDKNGSGYLQIRLVDDWGSAHMEWEPIGVVDMLFCKKYQLALHLEGYRELRKNLVEELKKNIESLPKNGEIGKSSRLFRWTITTDKPFGKMEEQELKTALIKYYINDAQYLFSILINRINEYSNHIKQRIS